MSVGKLSIRNPFHLRHKDGRRFIAVVLSCLMLAAVLFSSIHYHNDEQDHPECSICAVAHHSPAVSIFVPPYTPPTPVIHQIELTPYTKSFASTTSLTHHSRGPPA